MAKTDLSAAADAANTYMQLEATDIHSAIRFAHEYESKASPEAFDAYLHFLDLAYSTGERAA